MPTQDGLNDFNPRLDLVFERKSKLSAEQLWKGWTDPVTLNQWFCPKPWRVTESRMDLKPGGEFFTLMQGPQGEKMPNHGCFLETVPVQKLVWTNLMSAGFRPVAGDLMGFPFVATITFTKEGGATLYRAHIKHSTEEARKKHESMGFQDGWGMAYQQLEELMKS